MDIIIITEQNPRNGYTSTSMASVSRTVVVRKNVAYVQGPSDELSAAAI
jgi:hypothetical protein